MVTSFPEEQIIGSLLVQGSGYPAQWFAPNLASLFSGQGVQSPPAGFKVISLSGTVQHRISDDMPRIILRNASGMPQSFRIRVEEMLALAENWDDEGAQPVNQTSLANMVELVRRLSQCYDDFKEPFISPKYDGLVQIEWHLPKKSLEIEAVENGCSIFGVNRHSGGVNDYFESSCKWGDLSAFKNCYEWLVGDFLSWPLK